MLVKLHILLQHRMILMRIFLLVVGLIIRLEYLNKLKNLMKLLELFILSNKLPLLVWIIVLKPS
jgi:hypothetical protein